MAEDLVLKLVLTPTLIGLASLAGRRWGPGLAGWLVGLPLTSGPVAFFVGLNQGASFAAATALGTLAGTISQALFCLAYGQAARRGSSPVWSLLAGSAAFAAATLVLQLPGLPLPSVPLLLAVPVVAALALSLTLLPPLPLGEGWGEGSSTPAWDLPARMLAATALVLLLSGGAPRLGPHLTGLLTPFPVYATILALFAQRQQGPAAAIRVLRGLLVGLFSFTAFFVALAWLLEAIGLGPAFAVAIGVGLLGQGGSLWALRRLAG